MARRLFASPPGPSALPSPVGTEPSSRVRSQARGRRQRSRLGGGGDSRLPETPQSLLCWGALLTSRAARNPEPGGDLDAAVACGSAPHPSSASSPHRARASPLGGLASPRRGAPLARAVRLHPLGAPPPHGSAPAGPTPAIPSRLAKPRRPSQRHERKVASSLSPPPTQAAK